MHSRTSTSLTSLIGSSATQPLPCAVSTGLPSEKSAEVSAPRIARIISRTATGSAVAMLTARRPSSLWSISVKVTPSSSAAWIGR